MAVANQINVSGDGGVMKEILVEGSGESPSAGQEVEGLLYCCYYCFCKYDW